MWIPVWIRLCCFKESGRPKIKHDLIQGFKIKKTLLYSLVHKFSITFRDGEHMYFDRFEMPKVYMENGKVLALFLSAKLNGKENSFSEALPVNSK